MLRLTSKPTKPASKEDSTTEGSTLVSSSSSSWNITKSSSVASKPSYEPPTPTLKGSISESALQRYQERRQELVNKTLQQRYEWVDAYHQPPPNHIHKLDLIEFLDTLNNQRTQRKKDGSTFSSVSASSAITTKTQTNTGTTLPSSSIDPSSLVDPTATMTPLAMEALLLEEQRIHDQHHPPPSSSSYYSRFASLPQYTFHSTTDGTEDENNDNSMQKLRTMLPFTKGLDYLSSMDECIQFLLREIHEEETENTSNLLHTTQDSHPEIHAKHYHTEGPLSWEYKRHHQQHIQDIITKGFIDAVVQPYTEPSLSSSSSLPPSGPPSTHENNPEPSLPSPVIPDPSSTPTETSEPTKLLSLNEVADTPLPDEVPFTPLFAATDIPPKDFLSRLKHPQAADIIELLRSFLKNYKELDIVGIYDQLPDPDAYDDIEEEEETETITPNVTRSIEGGNETMVTSSSTASTEPNATITDSAGGSNDTNTSLTSVSNEDTNNPDWSSVLRPVHSSELFGSTSSLSSESIITTTTPTTDTKSHPTVTVSSSSDTVQIPLKVSTASNTSTPSKPVTRNPPPPPSLASTPSSSSTGTTTTGKPTPRNTTANKRTNPSTPKSPRVNIPSPADRVRAFLTRVEETLRSHPLWRNDTATEWDTTSEELEKFIMCRIFDDVFAAHSMCARRDRQLTNRMQSLSFITFRNLDLPEPSPRLAPGWRLAQAALRDIDRYKAPGDKLSCVMNSCRILSTLLTESVEERGGKDKGVGADEFLPALIYTVIKACPPRLYSSLRYIGEFRAPSKLMSEQGYFYTNVLSAVAFSKRVKPEQLSMTHSEFEVAVRQAKVRAEKKRLADIERGIEATSIARRLGKFRIGDGPVGTAEGDFAAELEVEKKLLALRISDSALTFAGLRKSASAIEFIEGAETFSSGRPSETGSVGSGGSNEENEGKKEEGNNTSVPVDNVKDNTHVGMDNTIVATVPASSSSSSGTENITDTDEYTATDRLSLSLRHIQHELERIALSDTKDDPHYLGNIPIPPEIHHLQQLRLQIDALIEQL